MDPKKLRKTTIDNVYVYVEDDFDLVGGRQEKYTFYDFSNIQPINVDSDTITINDKNYNIDDVLYKKYYKDLDPSFKRLRIYSDRHTFENRNYYYSKKLKQIRIFKQTADKGQYYYNLVPAIINKKKAFSCVADSGKTVIVFVDLIVDHEEEE